MVLIVADDMGYGDIASLGNPEVQTPVLDRLSNEGLVLSQHYAGSAVCAPSRAALMTGRYPHRTGAIDTLEGRGLDRLSLDEMTMGDAFKRLGYATGLVGKWHLGYYKWHILQPSVDLILSMDISMVKKIIIHT